MSRQFQIDTNCINRLKFHSFLAVVDTRLFKDFGTNTTRVSFHTHDMYVYCETRRFDNGSIYSVPLLVRILKLCVEQKFKFVVDDTVVSLLLYLFTCRSVLIEEHSYLKARYPGTRCNSRFQLI